MARKGSGQRRQAPLTYVKEIPVTATRVADGEAERIVTKFTDYATNYTAYRGAARPGTSGCSR